MIKFTSAAIAGIKPLSKSVIIRSGLKIRPIVPAALFNSWNKHWYVDFFLSGNKLNTHVKAIIKKINNYQTKYAYVVQSSFEACIVKTYSKKGGVAANVPSIKICVLSNNSSNCFGLPEQQHPFISTN